ncbi:PIG-L deacetylase family protein [Pseudoalteromonas sp. JC3]|uniref:PIG-L deacetylase family protein n=1 Tax=Pseudoalteromonas sp. JC3 TaxID=2810196 RepID=UPI0019D197E0|nr:PIG-L deacetylase family protein [Pseudoalteromonas sp. JC3]MBR8842453.1 PIG-L family deacetylase [Pseudoalteromonas sp. JC3]WJE09428.1 PIG-L deacetylase family protein [Pseudoalteromonas sp. JC3]
MEETNLVVVAHPDDEVLGFGATGAKLVSQGETVQPIILCGNVDVRTHRPSDSELNDDMLEANRILGFNTPILGGLPNIRMNNVDHVEIVQFIEKQILAFKPKRIFTHHPADLNDDHLQVSRACLAASRYYQRRNDIPPLKSLCYMEVLSSTDWGFEATGDMFKANLYVEVTEFIEKKLQALAAYRNVMRDFPHPRSAEVVKGLAAYRGGQSGQIYSEAFQNIFQQEL